MPGPGLFFDMGLGGGAGTDVAYGSQPRYGTSPRPSTASEAAYGSGGQPVQPRSGLHPGTPTGLIVWLGAGSLAWLVFHYISLPG